MATAAYADLTRAGRARRERLLVSQALAAYGLVPTTVRLAASAYNTVFRVGTADGRTFALRVGAPQHLATPETAEVEATWATALAAQTPVRPPQVVRTADGAPATTVGVNGVDGDRECVLFTWQPGRTLVDRGHPTELVQAAGAVLATLHDHASTFNDVSSTQVLRADRVCYFRLPNRLGEFPGVFSDAAAWAQERIDALWHDRGHAAHLIHGDFHPRNLMVWRGSLVPVDFQDVAWGLDVMDIAITLVMLEWADPTMALEAAFRRGYASVRRWPFDQAETLRRLKVARRLHVANVLYQLYPRSVWLPWIRALERELPAALRADPRAL